MLGAHEVREVTRKSVREHFEANKEILLGMTPPIGAFDADGKFYIPPEDAKRMFSVDEKGCTLKSITQARVVVASADTLPMTAFDHDLEHITVCPFIRADGQTSPKQAAINKTGFVIFRAVLWILWSACLHRPDVGRLCVMLWVFVVLFSASPATRHLICTGALYEASCWPFSFLVG